MFTRIPVYHPRCNIIYLFVTCALPYPRISTEIYITERLCNLLIVLQILSRIPVYHPGGNIIYNVFILLQLLHRTPTYHQIGYITFSVAGLVLHRIPVYHQRVNIIYLFCCRCSTVPRYTTRAVI